jgi:hypothetical protein
VREVCHILEGVDLDKEINFMMCGTCCEPSSADIMWFTIWTCQMFPEDFDRVDCDECIDLFSMRALAEVP